MKVIRELYTIYIKPFLSNHPLCIKVNEVGLGTKNEIRRTYFVTQKMGRG